MAPNRARRIFVLLIQTLPTFWAERIWILRLFDFLDLLDPNFQIFLIQPWLLVLGSWCLWLLVLGSCVLVLGVRSHLDLLEHSSAVAPRHSRTTKCGRCKELGQYRENPISASPVWGIIVEESMDSQTLRIRQTVK